MKISKLELLEALSRLKVFMLSSDYPIPQPVDDNIHKVCRETQNNAYCTGLVQGLIDALESDEEVINERTQS